MSKTETILNAQQICRAVCVRHALARFLQLSPDELDSYEQAEESEHVSMLSASLNALAGDASSFDLFSDDQRRLLSIALQLSEQEILYLLECAIERDDALDRLRA